MGQEGRESEMREDGRLDALVQKRVFLLERYLALTEEMVNCLEGNEEEKLGAFLTRRQTWMEEVDKNDILLSKAAKEHPGKGIMEQDHAQLRSIMSRIESLEKALADRMKKEVDALKQELLKMQTVRGATDKYRGHAGQEPRFLDVRDQ